MKIFYKLQLPKLLIGVLVFMAAQIPANAQLAIVGENFTGFPSNLLSGQYKGWKNVTSIGDTALDRWSFNNPVKYSVPTPLTEPVAILDSYNKGILNTGVNNNQPEEVSLVSPTVSTVGVSNLGLRVQHLLAIFANATGFMEVSTNGSTWTTVWSSSSLSSVPQTTVLNLNAYINQPTFSFRFRWNQPAAASGNGYWIVDNVLLYTTVAIDAGVTSLNTPVDFSCPNPAQPLSVRITNQGTTTLTNIPVNISFSGATTGSFSTTIGSLAAGVSTDVFTSNTINTNAGGTINFVITTNLSGDLATTNDTLKTSISTAPSATLPINTPIAQCGAGKTNLTVNSITGEVSFWYENSSTPNILGVGNPLVTPYDVSGSRKFYVENSRLLSNSLTTFFTGPYRYNAVTANGQAIFVDLTSYNDLFVDSFALSFAYAGQYTVDVYQTSGSYSGKETNQSAWTLLGTDTVTAISLGIPAYVNPKKVFTAGASKVTGFVFVCKQLPFVPPSLSPSQAFKLGAGSISNADATISGSSISNDAFVSFATGYFWDGTFYYRKACKSPRVAVDVIITPKPTGIAYQKGPKYNGLLKGGDLLTPDAVKLNDTVEYTVNAPGSYSNSDYNSKWIITGYTVKTTTGLSLTSTSDTVTSPPSGSNNAKIWLRPSGNLDLIYKISVTVKDLITGCDTVVDRHVYVADIPKADFVQVSGCLGSVFTFTNSSAIGVGSLSFKWYFGNGDSSDLPVPNYTYLTPGTYNVTLVATSNTGFTDVITKSMSVFAIPLADIEIGNACKGTAVTFTDKSTKPTGTPTYEWEFGDGSAISTVANPTHNYAIPGLYEVSFKVTVNGCSASLKKYATQAPRGTPDFTFIPAVCDNLDVKFTNISTNPDFGTMGSYWKFGDGGASTTVSPGHTYNQFKTFNVVLVITTDLGCIDSTTKTITLKEAPKVNFTTVGGVCTGEDVVFNNSTTIPAGSTNTYKWEFGDVVESTIDNPSHQYTSEGTYKVVLNAYSSNGCISKIEKTITINEKPIAIFDAEKVCQGVETKFINGSLINNGALSYDWDFDNGNNSQLVNPAITYGTAKTYNVRLIANSASGCKDTLTKQVVVAEIPAINIGVASSGWGDGTMKFQTNTQGTGIIYFWEFGDGGSSTLKNPDYKYKLGGLWTVKLTIRNADGCQSSASAQVFVNPVGVDNTAGEKPMTVYPNPTTGILNVAFGSDITSITITDVLGKTVVSFSPAGGIHETQVDLSNQPAGFYFINVSGAGDKSATQKIALVK